MNVKFYEGPAGSGKTTALMSELEAILDKNPLGDYQRVLALTFMHGARKRLSERLKGISLLKGRFDCRTIDSFAWHLVKRWRSLVKEIAPESVASELNYDENCLLAAQLLEYEEVRKWVAVVFPIVVVDEMQDCKGGRLGLLQQLSRTLKLLAAADEFQDLNDTGPNEAVNWLRQVGQTISLTSNHRTNVKALLEVSEQIRAGQPIRVESSEFKMIRAFNWAVSASLIAQNLFWWGVSDTVILSPTSSANSKFVGQSISRLTDRPIKIKRPQKLVGPFSIIWESTQQQDEALICQSIGLQAECGSVIDVGNLDFACDVKGVELIKAWVDKQRRLFGKTQFTKEELHEQVSKIAHQIRSFSHSSDRGIKAMTIHQAKNREFDNVIVLWPYEISGSPESLRRLLYNAVTRARKRVLVIVQDGSKNQVRLAKHPFC